MDKTDRIAALHAAAQSNDLHAASLLIDAMRHDLDADVRACAAGALRWLDAQELIPAALVEVIVNNQETPGVRGMALEAIRYHSPDDAIEALIRCLDDPFPEVRFWAVNTLGYTASHVAVSSLLDVAANDLDALPHYGAINVAASEAITSILQNIKEK